MPDVDLRADCPRCAAMCCVAFHFDRSAEFGFDKLAGEPCANLADEAGGGCRIHARLGEAGFGGCVLYDCHGAGPAVTQGLFGGRSWQSEPALLGPMMAAFLQVERAHKLLVVLAEAERLGLSAGDRGELGRLTAAVREAAAGAESVEGLEAEARVFLRGLRGYVAERRRPA